MRKTLLLSTLVFFPALAHAWTWDIPKNPDHFPSFGINVGKTDLNGSRTDVLWISSIRTLEDDYNQNETEKIRSIDLRLPVHESLTISFAYGHVDRYTRRDYQTRSLPYYEMDNLSGHSYQIGLRFYLNQ